MHEKEKALRERHSRELASLMRELEVVSALPPGTPQADRVAVHRYPLFGTEGRLIWKAKDLDQKQLLLVPSLLAPYEPLVRCKQGSFVAFATPEGMPFPVEDAEIGSMLIQVESDGSMSVRWVTRLAGSLWWVSIELPERWGKDWIGYRSLERVEVRSDKIAYEHRPITKCEWARTAIGLRHVTRYASGSAETPPTFVLQFGRDWDPLRLLTTVQDA